MAKLARIEATKAQAMQTTAESVADLHRKLDLIMEKLGIVDPEAPVTETQTPADPEPETEAPEAPAKGRKK